MLHLGYPALSKCFIVVSRITGEVGIIAPSRDQKKKVNNRWGGRRKKRMHVQ